MGNIIKTITLLLAAIVFAFAFSCKNGAADPVGEAQTSGQSAEEGEPGQDAPDLPEMDFKGKTYKALGRDDSSYPQFINFEIDAESITGELVNDAVYNRNRRLEEKYNVVIEKALNDDPAALLQRLIKADEDAYSLAFIRQFQIGAMASSGSFRDLNSLPYLNFGKPWWSKKINEAISIGGRLCFSTSDFNMMDKNRTYILMYSKDMAESHELGNLYELVHEGKWTVDRMTELCKAVARDLDGDGIMADKDQWGLGMDSHNSFFTFFCGCDNYMFTKNADDYPVLSLNNERTISSIDKILKLANDKNISFYCEDFVGKLSYDHWFAGRYAFTEGRSLFTTLFPHGIQAVAQSDTTVNYGILPFPKYDENQKDYISVTDSYHAALFAIPVTAQDPEFAAFMLEALSAASKYDVMPYYYEVSTKTKYTYDEESPKMLDLIFDGLRFDLGRMYEWGGASELLRETIPAEGTNSFVSRYEKIESKIMDDMEKTVEAFKERG